MASGAEAKNHGLLNGGRGGGFPGGRDALAWGLAGRDACPYRLEACSPGGIRADERVCGLWAAMDVNACGGAGKTAGARADSCGSRPDTTGSWADTTGSRADTTGSRADTAGSRAETTGSRADTAGSWADATGSRADTIGSRAATPGSSGATAASATDSVESGAATDGLKADEDCSGPDEGCAMADIGAPRTRHGDRHRGACLAAICLLCSQDGRTTLRSLRCGGELLQPLQTGMKQV